jgi:hypothetical protein
VKEIVEDAQGPALINAVTGARITLRRRPADVRAEPILEIEAWLPRGWRDPRRHRHPSQEERVHVLEGKLVAEIGGWSRAYSAGETFIIPAGVDHSLLIADTGTHIVTEFTPPLETANLMELFHRLAAAGQVDRSGWPRPLAAAIIARQFAPEFVVADSPRVGPAIMRALARIAVALRHRTVHAGPAADPSVEVKPHSREPRRI